MTSIWERLRTLTDLCSAQLGFCLKKSIFALKNSSESFGNEQKHFQAYSSSERTDNSRKDSGTDDIEVEGGCTTNHASNNNADDSIQPYEREYLADEEWICRDHKERNVERKHLVVG